MKPPSVPGKATGLSPLETSLSMYDNAVCVSFAYSLPVNVFTSPLLFKLESLITALAWQSHGQDSVCPLQGADASSMPGRGSKVPHAGCHSQKNP